MPELPEVEVICRFLSGKITGKSISCIQINRKNLRVPITENIANLVEKQKITKIWRRGKYIIFSLSNCHHILIHLGMSGRLLYYQNHCKYQQNKHDHAIFFLNNNSSLIFNDPRRFGLIISLNHNECIEFLEKLALEPLSDNFNTDYLQTFSNNRNINVKSSLINNKLVVGVGNIYASESLFKAKISPTRILKTLTPVECTNLVKSIKSVLKFAISLGGSTLKDYINPVGNTGKFQNHFSVYNKDGQLCSCNNKIIKIKQNGRSTFYCANCQK